MDVTRSHACIAADFISQDVQVGVLLQRMSPQCHATKEEMRRTMEISKCRMGVPWTWIAAHFAPIAVRPPVPDLPELCAETPGTRTDERGEWLVCTWGGLQFLWRAVEWMSVSAAHVEQRLRALCGLEHLDIGVAGFDPQAVDAFCPALTSSAEVVFDVKQVVRWLLDIDVDADGEIGRLVATFASQGRRTPLEMVCQAVRGVYSICHSRLMRRIRIPFVEWIPRATAIQWVEGASVDAPMHVHVPLALGLLCSIGGLVASLQWVQSYMPCWFESWVPSKGWRCIELRRFLCNDVIPAESEFITPADLMERLVRRAATSTDLATHFSHSPDGESAHLLAGL